MSKYTDGLQCAESPSIVIRVLKQLAAFAGLAFFLVGAVLAEETKTVDWFKANAEDRKATIAKCRNNPGELGRSPNCINASKAASEITWAAKGAGVKVAPLTFNRNDK